MNALQHIARVAGDPAHPLVLKLDEPALRHLDGHLGRLHHDLQRCEGVEAAWLGKGRGTVVRLALAFTLLGWAVNAAPASAATRHIGDEIFGACRLWDYFRAHARAVLARAFPSDGERPCARCWPGSAPAARPRSAARTCAATRSARRSNAHEALQVIQSLERAGFLRKVDHQPDGAGRPPLRWDVNPS